MFSVPMGLIGVFWALYLTNTTQLRRHGMDLQTAGPRAGRIRLRPILMTTLTTVVGLLPMAFAYGVGTEANQPLAIAVIGGLLVSTFFTLVLIPTLYVMFEERFPRRMGSDEDDAGGPA
jgi:multidrug efflux pump subunit AcrB